MTHSGYGLTVVDFVFGCSFLQLFLCVCVVLCTYIIYIYMFVSFVVRHCTGLVCLRVMFSLGLCFVSVCWGACSFSEEPKLSFS